MGFHQGLEAVPHNLPESSEESPLRAVWRRWADLLRRRHLDGIVAALIEAGQPLALVAAQLLYVGQPILGRPARLLAQMLESETESSAFLRYLGAGADGAAPNARGSLD